MSKAWTVSKIKKQINSMIKNGHADSTIFSILSQEIPMDQIDSETLKRIVTSVVAEHPSYNLIQKISRSKLIVDKNSNDDNYYILDPISETLDTIHRIRLGGLFGKMDFSDKTFVCNFEYQPSTSSRLYKNKEGIWVYNTYTAPNWIKQIMKSDSEAEPEDLPFVYFKFLNHLVDEDAESYEYILSWLATALKSRNYCILTTIGNQGIGKGVLGDIIRLLAGEPNFVKTECRVLTKDFNKQILNKRVVYIDELIIRNSSEENKLKTLVNDFIEIEGKGIDAKEVENHASIYVSSNDLDSIRLRGDDRRFSIINLTSKKLITIMTPEEIKSMFKSENIEKLGRFLWNLEVDSDKMMRVFTSKRTEEVRSSALKGWEEYILDDLAIENEGQSVLLSDVSDAVENNFGSRCRPSKVALKKLQELYPDLIKVEQKTKKSKKSWYVTFSKGD